MGRWPSRAPVAVAICLCLLSLVGLAKRAHAAQESSTDGCFAPSPDGYLGAWLVAGPFDRSRLPEDARLSPRFDAPVTDPAAGPRWRLAAAGDGPIALSTVLDSKARDHIAYAAGVLHLDEGGQHVLSLGAN